MNREEIIKRLLEYKTSSALSPNIKEIGVFGSYATGNGTSASDIDIFVLLKKPRMFDLVRIQHDLRALFGKEVDVVAVTKSMNGYLKRQIREHGIVA
jgi:predicted nucleotidyltransferase